ncbi:amidohydrolase [Sphingobacterium sp. N143]|uniref:amidohydrolase n=1 Tax=Sphingobacterium sp. N143 TaxID=2746727 RepID=UPI002577DD95|nr:amidohydrolase [Sphingobacterium sp. N143]MDM1295099.1 amidohydrolase [Sphingobacterium sp. N143]
MKTFPIIFLFFCWTIIACSTQTKVDLIVYNAQVYTVDSTFSKAKAFAVKEGKFIAIGSDEEIQRKYKSKETINAEGRSIYPGFYDAHAHLFDEAELMDQVDLNGADSFEEVIQRVKTYQQKNPDKTWLIGGGWDQNRWRNKTFPTKDLLDKAFPDVPVYLMRVDYHAAVANSKALERAKLTSIPNIHGGVVGGNNNIPNGLLIDNAMDLVNKAIPVPDEKEYLRMLKRTQDSLLSVGLTSIVDAGLSKERLELLKKYYKEGQLKFRDYAMILGNPENIKSFIDQGFYETERFEIKGFKLLADGALGSRGACLLAHYHDAATHGFLLHSPQEYEEMIKQIAASKFQANTHAIGDSANRIILDIYGKYLQPQTDRRWRIEHAQIISPADFDKFRKFQIIPSVQPTHATSDMYWAKDRLGEERMKGAYAYKHLLKEYGKLALGSDFPVEHFNPMYGFHAAVARVDKQGYPDQGFQMQDAISREDALRGMTIWAAYSCFQEQKRGSIEAGKDADFVILEKDILKIPNEQLRGVKTLRTVIAGETVFIR